MNTKRPSLREKAAEILAAAFPTWDISEEDIVPVGGFWKRVDVYRWQAFFHLKDSHRYSNGDRIPMSIGCWETLTCFCRDAKNGVFFDDGEVWAKES